MTMPVRPRPKYVIGPDGSPLTITDLPVYRALKSLGFSHVSARPKAYKQDTDAVEAFKKTFPPVWRRSARSLRLAHP
jgi:Winged helix-turn helix